MNAGKQCDENCPYLLPVLKEDRGSQRRVDIISLGIGIGSALEHHKRAAEALGSASHHIQLSRDAGVQTGRGRMVQRRFGVELTPGRKLCPYRIKEGIANISACYLISDISWYPIPIPVRYRRHS